MIPAWRECNLGDVINLKRGYDLPHDDRVPGPYPVVSSSGITDHHSEPKVKGPGVVTGRYGTLGQVFFVEQDFWPLNTSLYVQDFKENDPRFISYLLRTLNFATHNAAGAVPGVNRNHLHALRVRIPPLPVQRRIAGILSAYDNLIDNAQTRIRIFEAMAHSFYREWFVHLRFPGHTQVARVTSSSGRIPKGWRVTTLGVHLAALESGKRPKGGIREETNGVPSIGAENINGIGRHDFSREKLVPREFFELMRGGVVRDRDVAIYKDGAYIGKSSVFRDGFPHSECCVNEHVFLLRGDGVHLTQSFLYLWLQEPETVRTIRSKNANAAQPGLNQQTIGGLELVLPDEKTAVEFDRLVEPLMANIISLAKRIKLLCQTRDLLLPRLVMGQTEVQSH